MTDKATLIERLEDAAERVQEAGFRGHGTVSRTIAEAVEALKAQEPVKPRMISIGNVKGPVCGNCGLGVIGCYYCRNCGREVKWDA